MGNSSRSITATASSHVTLTCIASPSRAARGSARIRKSASSAAQAGARDRTCTTRWWWTVSRSIPRNSWKWGRALFKSSGTKAERASTGFGGREAAPSILSVDLKITGDVVGGSELVVEGQEDGDSCPKKYTSAEAYFMHDPV